MAGKAGLRDLFVLLAVGKDSATLQRRHLAAQCRLEGKRDRRQASSGRAYYSQVRIEAPQQIAAWRLACAAADIAAKPYRFVASLGHYDAAHTR